MDHIKAVAFDWGGTIMREIPDYSGPMAHWPHIEVLPGVTEALKELYGQTTCALATNTLYPTNYTRAALERGGIQVYFHHVFTSHELRVAKPNPAFFNLILQELKLKPSQVVMVGDHYRNDIAGAKAVGLHTVWLRENSSDDEAPDADLIVSKMADVPAAVTQIDRSISA